MELKEVARSLLSPSAQFEGSLPTDPAKARQGMELWVNLSHLTQRSLPLQPQVSPAVAAALQKAAPELSSFTTPSGAPSVAPAPRPVTYQTSNPEYQGALRDRSVIEALLALESSKQPAGAAAPSSFQSPRLPQVTQAEPKRGFLPKQPGIYHPVLRPPTER